jgi:hypothetical protein
MCLSTVEEIPQYIVKRKKKIGWKIFYGSSPNALKPYMYSVGGKEFSRTFRFKVGTFRYKVGKWYTSTKGSLGPYPNNYNAGFHIYRTRDEARTQSKYIHKVEYDNVVAYGKQSGQRVVVAQKMRILS